MAQAELDKYAWLSDSAESPLGEAGCVTVVVGDDEAGVQDSFGVDRKEPVSLEQAEQEGRFFVATYAGPDAVVAYEVNGFQGSRVEVLKVASKRGKAASIFWNVNAMVVFACARRGKVLCAFELDAEPGDETPKRLLPLLRLLEDAGTDPVAVGAAMVEKFTGAAIPRPDASTLTEGYVVHPRMDALYPASADSRYLLAKRRDVVDAIAAADPRTSRALAEWAATQAARQASLLGDERLAGMLAQLGSNRPCSLTPEFLQLLSEVQRILDDVRSRDPSRHGGRALLPVRISAMPVWALTAFRHLAFDDSTAAALGAVDTAHNTMGVDGVGDEFLNEAVRLLTIAPEDWPTAARALSEPPSAEDRAAAIEWERTQPERDAAQARVQFEEREAVHRRERDEYYRQIDAGIIRRRPDGTDLIVATGQIVAAFGSTPQPAPLTTGATPPAGGVAADGRVIGPRFTTEVQLPPVDNDDQRPQAAYETSAGVVTVATFRTLLVRWDGGQELLSQEFPRGFARDIGGNLVAFGEQPLRGRVHGRVQLVDVDSGERRALDVDGKRFWNVAGLRHGAVWLNDSRENRSSYRYDPDGHLEALPYYVRQVDPVSGTILATDAQPGNLVLRTDGTQTRLRPGPPLQLAPGAEMAFFGGDQPKRIVILNLRQGEEAATYNLPAHIATPHIGSVHTFWEDHENIYLVVPHWRTGPIGLRLNIRTGEFEEVPPPAELGAALLVTRPLTA